MVKIFKQITLHLQLSQRTFCRSKASNSIHANSAKILVYPTVVHIFYSLGKNVFGTEEEGCQDDGDQFWACASSLTLDKERG